MPAALAKSLSAAAYRFFYESLSLPSSPAGARAAWTKDVAKHASALLANFGMDPDTFVFSPPPDGITALLASDYPNILYLSDQRARACVERQVTTQFLGAMQIPPHPAHDPPTSQELLEWWSLCGGLPTLLPSPDERREAVRVTLMGLAFVARSAALAIDFYRHRKKKHWSLTPRGQFGLDLSQIYLQTFGKPPTTGAPSIRFFTEIAKRLQYCEAPPGADPTLDRAMRDLLKRWATNPAAIRELLRDARAIDRRTGTRRRVRDGRT